MTVNAILPPETTEELMLRVDEIAGLTLEQLARLHALSVPKNLLKNKGWIGQLIEKALGANAGSKPEQDFKHLGIELKTIPINQQGRPLETTFISSASLTNINGLIWKQSLVYEKLQQILWIPVQGERHIPIKDRRVGTGILWRPSKEEENQLQQDWEEIMELIAMGKVAQISARHGEVLQLRPKAANSKVLTESIAENGQIQLTNPRGFYLKIDFTHRILQQAFG